MGCNCGKQRAAPQRAPRMRSAAPIVGLTRDKPVVLGDEASGEPRRVRAARPVASIRSGQAAWVVGSGVDEAIEDGALIDISKTTQRRRLWRVGAYTYSDESKARRVARALGQEAVEIA